MLKNFKIWKTTGLVRLAPVRLLLGTNSSGKSKIIQSLLLIRQTVRRQVDGSFTITRQKRGAYRLSVGTQRNSLRATREIHPQNSFTFSVATVAKMPPEDAAVIREAGSPHLSAPSAPAARRSATAGHATAWLRHDHCPDPEDRRLRMGLPLGRETGCHSEGIRIRPDLPLPQTHLRTSSRDAGRDNPVFAKDAVCNTSAQLQNNARIEWFEVKAINHESVHNHSAVAAVNGGGRYR
jgi:hypothetical protein